VIERGVLSAALTSSWNANKLEGCKYLIMQPSSKEPVYLRFIEDPSTAKFEPMKTAGWNAIEILVKDPDKLAESFTDSQNFKVVGKPRYLTGNKNIKAMQAIGPANELIYFTNISDPSKSGFGLLPAKSYVDRIFIMVVGARNYPALNDFYRNTLDMFVTEPMLYRIGVLSGVYDLADETRHEISIAKISNRFLVEMDKYPDTALPGNIANDSLPPGIAMVTFEVEKLLTGLTYVVPPGVRQTFPYKGRKSALIIGPAGEYMELVEKETTNVAIH